jgi:hypothetical protein
MTMTTHRVYFVHERKNDKARAVCSCGWWCERDTKLECELEASVHDLKENKDKQV